jgi:hypothetical protein
MRRVAIVLAGALLGLAGALLAARLVLRARRFAAWGTR